MIVAFDQDGVLADLTTPWLEAYNKGYNDNLKAEDITDWDFHQFVKPECGTNIYKYLSLPEFYSDLPVMPGAQEATRAIQVMGYEVMIVSASPKAAYRDKYEWLQEHFSNIPSDNIMFVRNKSLVRADILVDDGVHNLLAFEKAGGIPIIFDQPYNRGLNRIRVCSFSELRKLFNFFKACSEHMKKHAKSLPEYFLRESSSAPEEALNSALKGSLAEAYREGPKEFISDAMRYIHNRRVL